MIALRLVRIEVSPFSNIAYCLSGLARVSFRSPHLCVLSTREFRHETNQTFRAPGLQLAATSRQGKNMSTHVGLSLKTLLRNSKYV